MWMGEVLHVALSHRPEALEQPLTFGMTFGKMLPPIEVADLGWVALEAQASLAELL
jgi:hypothetical protein